MEKVLFRFRINHSLDSISVVNHIREQHGWFFELVNSVGVRCCGNSSNTSTATDFSEIDMDLEEMAQKNQEIQDMIMLLNEPMEEEELLQIKALAEALSHLSDSDED